MDERGSARRCVLGLLVLGSVAFFSHASLAEDFRVFTAVYDVSRADDGESGPIVARTVTLFHAGKVYDYIETAHSAEIIIFEPTLRRFRILNPSRGIVTTAAFDEIKHKLGVAREETAREARILSSSDTGQSGAAQMLTFQLSPTFETTFRKESRKLELRGQPITYQLQTVRPERSEIVDTYLNYADWVCRLNYVLSVGPILPAPRLAVNSVLREHQVLPEIVILKAKTQPPMHLRAEHTFHLELNAKERGWIHQWESQLDSGTIRTVTLQEYQKEVLTSPSN